MVHSFNRGDSVFYATETKVLVVDIVVVVLDLVHRRLDYFTSARRQLEYWKCDGEIARC